jgi:hypothetical protein
LNQVTPASVETDHPPHPVREKSMNAFMRAVAALVLLVAVSCAIPPAGPEPAPTTFTVLFFNDLHGHLRPFSVQTNQGKNEVGGIARLATLVKTIRAENARAGAKTVLLVAGTSSREPPCPRPFMANRMFPVSIAWA